MGPRASKRSGAPDKIKPRTRMSLIFIYKIRDTGLAHRRWASACIGDEMALRPRASIVDPTGTRGAGWEEDEATALGEPTVVSCGIAAEDNERMGELTLGKRDWIGSTPNAVAAVRIPPSLFDTGASSASLCSSAVCFADPHPKVCQWPPRCMSTGVVISSLHSTFANVL